jgi:hypothetical protein
MLITRLFTILVGLGITLFGIKYTLDIFLIIYDYLQNPDTLAAVIEKWLVLLNIKGLVIAGYPLDKLLAIVILAIGALLLLRITLGFISAGTTILINSANVAANMNTGHATNERVVINLDSKLNKLRSMADQGTISKQAYEEARDKYLVQKIMTE